MAKENKGILGIHASYWAVIFVLVAVGYFYRKDLKGLLGIKKKTGGSGSDAKGEQSSGSGSGSSGSGSSSGGGVSTGGNGGGTTATFSLTSAQIKELQDLINDARDARYTPELHDDIAVDGVMGKQTTDALLALGVQTTISSSGDYSLIMADLEAIIDYWL